MPRDCATEPEEATAIVRRACSRLHSREHLKVLLRFIIYWDSLVNLPVNSEITGKVTCKFQNLPVNLPIHPGDHSVLSIIEPEAPGVLLRYAILYQYFIYFIFYHTRDDA